MARRDTQLAASEGGPVFHVIVSGRVKLSLFHPETGREHIPFLLGPADGFDTVSLLDGQPSGLVATALYDTEARLARRILRHILVDTLVRLSA